MKYKDLIYDKVQSEYDEFVKSLEQLTPKEIIDKAYEKVIKEEIASQFEYRTITESEAMALYRKSTALETIYQEWLKNDYSYCDVIEFTIDDCLRRERRHMLRDEEKGGR